MKIYSMPRQSGKTMRVVEWVKEGRTETNPNHLGGRMRALGPFENNRAVLVHSTQRKRQICHEHMLMESEVLHPGEVLSPKRVGEHKEIIIDEALLLLRVLMSPYSIYAITFTPDE